MPRGPRKKSEESMYHIMCRSISETDLFQNDEDKAYYLALVKRYKEKYHCLIYAYCLMNNHVHFYINPCGFDISSFMRSLNTAYVNYYNKRYQRHGHLFQGRFASTIVDNDTYSLTLSAYIHNNAKDLPEGAGKEEQYRYSSYGIYTGARQDKEGIVDTDNLLSVFSQNKEAARQKIRTFTETMRETGIMREVDQNIMSAYAENEYRSEKSYITRTTTPEAILSKVEDIIGEKLQDGLRMKHYREASSTRAFITYILKTLCGYTYKKLSQYLGNMSASGISRLVNEGFRLYQEQTQYRSAFNVLISTK